MPSSHPFGQPINILSFTNPNEIIADDSELDKVFNHPEIQDRKVVILSIIGAFRGGKSFFLDYCLRFLYSHFPSINNPWQESQLIFEKNDNWMGDADEPLTGFSWRSGTKRDTTGIIIWSDVFLHTMDRTGEKIAIFVMDTQGLFDNDSTPTDNSRIFALGTLISSIQVLNLMNRVQEDQLQYLQFATELAKFMNAETNDKAFQNLTFLIRDWVNEEEFELGIEGGAAYFEEEVLKMTETQKPELRSVRESIRSSFESIGCCLLPHPGTAILRGKNYDGKRSAMEQDFEDELKKVIEFILLPDNLTIKKINAQEIFGKELRSYIDEYFGLFQSSVIPEARSIYDMTVDSHMNNLVRKCIDDYYMTIYRNSYLFKFTKKSISVVHDNCKAKALKLFDSERKLGTDEQEQSYRTKLENEIQEIYLKYHENMIYQFAGIEKVKEKMEFTLECEKLQKVDSEKTLMQAEGKLTELEEKLEQKLITLDEYERLKKILQDRIEAERERLERIQGSKESNLAFALEIAKNVGIALGIGILAAASTYFVATHARF